MRVIIQALSRCRDFHIIQPYCRLFVCLFLSDTLVSHKRLRHLSPNGQDRVERGHGLLEDHGNLTPPYLAKALRIKINEIPALEHNPICNSLPRRRWDQPQDTEGGYTLAAARLSHEPQGFASGQIKADPVHCPGHTLRGMELDRKIVYLQQVFHHKRSPGYR